MQYLTYEQYQEIGGELDLTAFNRSIDRATGLIDAHTFNRVREMREVPSQVKACARDLVDYIANNNLITKTITSKSQSAGSVSESESYAEKTLEQMTADMTRIVYDYLSSVTDDYFVPVLYRGCCR
jgi:hypothetical protein